MARQVARRRQRERFAGIAVVGLGVVVLVVALLALREPRGHVAATGSAASNVAHRSPSDTESSRPSTGSTTTAPSVDDPTAVPLVVLNNSFVQGLAQQASDQFEAGGWTVTKIDDLQNDIISTCAYFDPSDPAAKAAAKALRRQFSGIQRVEPKFPELPSGPVVVVLTGDYSTT